MKKFLSLILALCLVSAMMVSAVAEANFTPSVTGKPAPLLVPFVENGQTYVARILNGALETISLIPSEGIKVTPLAEAQEEAKTDPQAYTLLRWTYDELCATEDVGAFETLDKGVQTTVGAVINEQLIAKETELTYVDLTISDLFDLAMSDSYYQVLKSDEDNVVQLTFNTKLEPDDIVIVLFTTAEDVWNVVEAENVIINEDGTLTLRLDDVGAISFMVEGDVEPFEVDGAGLVSAP